MGKKRINQLLDQLKENQQADLQNAAAIYTVAQVAVSKLAEQPVETSLQVESSSKAALLPAPSILSKSELLARYGSYNGCRRAAKQAGIKFKKTPSWLQLTAALSQAAEIQTVVDNYIKSHPQPGLSGFTLTVHIA